MPEKQRTTKQEAEALANSWSNAFLIATPVFYDVPETWATYIEAFRRHGWNLTQWAVAQGSPGKVYAYPVFSK